MIKQSSIFNDIFEKKFKILRTSILLGNIKDRSETFKEYEEVAREVDKIRNNDYIELLASKNYTPDTLQDEQTRLKELISLIKNRIKERNDFVDDYIRITSNFLDGLDKAEEEKYLDKYQLRLSNINEYYANCEEITNLNRRLKILRDELEEKYDNKSNNELINSKLEEELIEEFNKIITKDEYYSTLDYTDIDSEIRNLENSIEEKKGVMNTFNSSYEALASAGISGAEREEYLSYVQDARLDYYKDVEKKCILEIYKLILDKESNYYQLYDKRETIHNILEERMNVRKELDIKIKDDIDSFTTLSKEQFEIIKAQKYNIEKIDNIILEISNCEEKLTQLENSNNRTEILKLIEEYSVEKTEIEKIELPQEKEKLLYEDKTEFTGERPSNMVIKVKEPVKINVKNATDTAKLVMKKVVIVLEPKKFNTKRDKLKEAEIELAKQRIAKIEIAKKEEEIAREEAAKKEKELERLKAEAKEKAQAKIITTTDGNLGIELDTKAVYGKKDVKELDELDEIKINTTNSNNIKLPTEIFVEEPAEEPQPELFKATDPFLDDNEYEISKKGTIEESFSNLPKIGSIGTVKPNSAFSKIESAVKENDNIILPTLGLSGKENIDVPIVSENYID